MFWLVRTNIHQRARMLFSIVSRYGKGSACLRLRFRSIHFVRNYIVVIFKLSLRLLLLRNIKIMILKNRFKLRAKYTKLMDLTFNVTLNIYTNNTLNECIKMNLCLKEE